MNNDLISRQAAIEIIQSMYPGMPRVPWMLKNWKKQYEPYIRLEKEIKGLPSTQPEPGWIPVTERLPEYREKVLVTFHNKYIDRTTIGISFCYMQKEGFFSDKPFDYVAVAWMPLPKPWKGESDATD